MLDTMNMAKQLSGDYRETFEWVDMYSMPLGVSEEWKDERLMELYDLLLEAEHNGKPVEKIVGRDLEVFCRNFFEEEMQPSRIKILLSRSFSVALMIFAFSILDLLWQEDMTDLFPIVLGIGAGILADIFAKYFLHPIALKKKLKPILYACIVIGIWLGIVAIIVVIGASISYELEISLWLSLIISGSYLLVYIIVSCISRYRENGIIFSANREERKAVKAFNKEIQNAGLIGTTAKGMASRYKRIQKRKRRKGIEYTFGEFAEKIRKEKVSVKKINVICSLFLSMIVLIPGIEIAIDETLLDGLLFMGVTGVVEFFIGRWTVRSNKQMMDLQIRVVDECEEKGIDILEYIGEKETYNEQQ